MRYIITGATGMIVISIMNLLKENNEIYAIVRPGSSKIKNIPVDSNIHVIECDVSDLCNVSLPDSDVLFHLAWKGTIDGRDDSYTQLDNVKYTLDACKLAKKSNCSVFVGAGSQAEYGLKEEALNGNMSVDPVTGYGVCKYTAGKLSRIFAQNMGLRHIWVRILSVYGPGDNKKTLISSCIDSILNNKPFDTTEGNQMWDYIYSEDCARAFIKVATSGVDGKVYTIGSGKIRPLREYIEIIRDNINPDFNVGFGRRAYNKNQVMYLKADISELVNDTGFVPQITFEEGIKRTIKWFRRNN